MSFQNIKLSQYLKDLSQEEIPLLRFDPAFIILFNDYLKKKASALEKGVTASALDKLVTVINPPRFATRRFRVQKIGCVF